MAQADFTRISTNIAALNTLNSLRSINTKLGTAQLRLATGKRINQASDDPAGLTIAMKLSARNESLKMALSNIGDAKNMLSVAEGGLQQINDILIEMKAKAVQAASDTLGEDERAAIQSQLISLARQINDIVDEIKWNNAALLDGTVNKTLQTGATEEDTTAWQLSQNHQAVQLGVASGSATSATFSVVSVDTSFDTDDYDAGVSFSTAFGGLTELETGTYKFKITDKATSATVGKATTLSTVTGLEDLDAAAATADYELASGQYTLKIDAHTGATIDYTIYDSLGNVVATRDGLNAATATQLKNTAGNRLGVMIDVAAGGIATNAQFNFEYISRGKVKMELYQIVGSTEELVEVDANGSDETGTDVTRPYFYVSVTGSSPSYDTGLGFKVHLDQGISTVNVGDVSEFNYIQAGDVSVDVSTAAKASAYMTAVDNAINTVTQSLNSIGSLVARLNSKEATVSVDQVNTEASYSRIMNADMAYEQVEAAKYLILQQTAIAMLAQANAAPQGILSLFR